MVRKQQFNLNKLYSISLEKMYIYIYVNRSNIKNKRKIKEIKENESQISAA